VTPKLNPPEPLADGHCLDAFDSGQPALDDWLRRRARANQAGGASRTYVVTEGVRVVAYYALSSGALDTRQSTGRFRRNMPDPIPVAVLGRLAVDRAWQGRGLARAMVRDALLRVANAADAIGVRGVVVHALSEEAKPFWLSLGFDPSPAELMTLMITLTDLRALLD
jgi:GNAT superfamily N-acetyltransferase